MQSGRRGQIGVTIGICAYNEAQNIGKLLQALLDQRTEVARIEEVLVVASGCTDGTLEIVEAFHDNHEAVQLFTEKERRGKASAINEILPRAKGEVVILESADTIPRPNSVEFLVRPFADPTVGVVAARPVPVDDDGSFWVDVGRALWDLHHEVCLLAPKTGEMFAFRPVFAGIPGGIGADEDWIRNMVEKKGYKVLYEPAAIVCNSSPKSLDEFLKQRVRCNIQELHQSRQSSFVTPTWQTGVMVNALLGYLRQARGDTLAFLSLSSLEFLARFYSLLRVRVRQTDLGIWERLPSTKSLDPSEALDDNREGA